VRTPRTGQLDYAFTAVDKPVLTAVTDLLRENQPKSREAVVQHPVEVIKHWQQVMLSECDAIVEALQQDTGRLMLAHHEFDSLHRTIDRLCLRAPLIPSPYKKASAAMPEV
jgi:hypothetical protein